MKIIIAPLNWGLGHATRCLPLIVRHLRAGDDVILAGDGESLALLKKHFPNLPSYPLASLQMRYSSGRSQVGAMLCALPKIMRFIRQDRHRLKEIVEMERPDMVISDNRFGLHCKGTKCVYITHQLTIPMPRGLRWAEPIGRYLHRLIIRQYDECWIPDREGDDNLSGRLSHGHRLPAHTRYIGPLSRFEYVRALFPGKSYHALAILSGPEPQRTILEKAIIREYENKPTERLLIVRGKITGPQMEVHQRNITMVPTLDDGYLRYYLASTPTIISRSGYSSLMDYDYLGLSDLHRKGKITIRVIPTPGQPEQEYLAERWAMQNAH